MKIIALLHPGNMGSTIGACAATSGARVLWASAERSGESRKRAEQAGLIDAGDLAAAVTQSDIVLSVCPPEFAADMAAKSQRRSFQGIYVDANAVSRATAEEIGKIVTKGWRQLRRRRHHRLAGQKSRHH